MASAERVQPTEPAETPAAEPVPLLTLRDGMPPLADTPEALAEVCARVAAGSGPVAVDAERASGYRYSARAYLIQLRRAGAGTALVDPVALHSLAPLADVLGDSEWVLHAATQDLPCLAEVGLRPSSLFDTELAARLLGLPKVGLATLVETLLGRRMRKEHAAVDWSTRPLPTPWLEYAALDVEPLIELRATLAERLEAAGKEGWAAQEFTALLDFRPAVRDEPWRRTSGMHRVRGARGLAAVRALWEERDAVAAERDVAPGRLIPDSAIVAAAQALPADRQSLLTTPGFHGRGAGRFAQRWVAALRQAQALPESQLPTRQPRGDGPPPPRSWAERDPEAARRLERARRGLTALAARVEVPVENLLTPEHVRRVLWSPPSAPDADALAAAVADRLAGYGARRWQVELTCPVIAAAILGEAEESA